MSTKTEKKYICEKCNHKPFSGASGLWYHKKRKHNMKTRTIKRKKNNTQKKTKQETIGMITRSRKQQEKKTQKSTPTQNKTKKRKPTSSKSKNKTKKHKPNSPRVSASRPRTLSIPSDIDSDEGVFSDLDMNDIVSSVTPPNTYTILDAFRDTPAGAGSRAPSVQELILGSPQHTDRTKLNKSPPDIARAYTPRPHSRPRSRTI